MHGIWIASNILCPLWLLLKYSPENIWYFRYLHQGIPYFSSSLCDISTAPANPRNLLLTSTSSSYRNPSIICLCNNWGRWNQLSTSNVWAFQLARKCCYLPKKADWIFRSRNCFEKIFRSRILLLENFKHSSIYQRYQVIGTLTLQTSFPMNFGTGLHEYGTEIKD